MSEMNETRLHGWRPRRPSAGVKRRIVRALGAPAPIWNWHRLAPATACLLFALLMIHFNSGDTLPPQKPAMAMVFSNGIGPARFSDGAQEAQNHLAAVTFDWTNDSVLRSSIGFQSGSGPTTNLSN